MGRKYLKLAIMGMFLYSCGTQRSSNTFFTGNSNQAKMPIFAEAHTAGGAVTPGSVDSESTTLKSNSGNKTLPGDSTEINAGAPSPVPTVSVIVSPSPLPTVSISVTPNPQPTVGASITPCVPSKSDTTVLELLTNSFVQGPGASVQLKLSVQNECGVLGLKPNKVYFDFGYFIEEDDILAADILPFVAKLQDGTKIYSGTMNRIAGHDLFNNSGSLYFRWETLSDLAIPPNTTTILIDLDLSKLKIRITYDPPYNTNIKSPDITVALFAAFGETKTGKTYVHADKIP